MVTRPPRRARAALGSRRHRTDDGRYSRRSVTAFRRAAKTRSKRRLTTPTLERPHEGQSMEQIATKCPRSRAVIVGAGFGGLAAAKRLAEGPVDVTIIDQRNYHLFQPLLPPSGQSRHHRSAPGHRRFRPGEAHRSDRMVALGPRPQLFSHRRPSADDLCGAMVLGLPHLRQRRAAHHRASAALGRSEDAGPEVESWRRRAPSRMNGEPPRSRLPRRSPRVMRRPAVRASRRRRESGLRSRTTVDRLRTCK